MPGSSPKSARGSGRRCGPSMSRRSRPASPNAGRDMATVGVLAVQGAFAAHARVLARQGHRVIEVRSASDLDRLDGLVLPGGESSVQLEMIDRLGLEAPLLAFMRSGTPILATCAGLILLARTVENPSQRSLACLDVVVRRNAWGRQ